jgi:hypothetical protein
MAAAASRNSTGYRDVHAGASDNAVQTVSAAKQITADSRCEGSTSATGIADGAKIQIIGVQSQDFLLDAP